MGENRAPALSICSKGEEDQKDSESYIPLLPFLSFFRSHFHVQICKLYNCCTVASSSGRSLFNPPGNLWLIHPVVEVVDGMEGYGIFLQFLLLSCRLFLSVILLQEDRERRKERQKDIIIIVVHMSQRKKKR